MYIKTVNGGNVLDRLILIFISIVALFSGITYLLWRVSKRVKLVKYTPALLCLLAGVYYVYLAKTVQIHGGGFEDLANLMMAMMFLTGFVSGIAMCLIIDFIVPRFKS